MKNSKPKTQKQLLAHHLKNIGAINTDEARQLYSIVDVPTLISKLSKRMGIKHRPINRPNPTTGKVRGIMEYSLVKEKAE